jgi:hypothetical protein
MHDISTGVHFAICYLLYANQSHKDRAFTNRTFTPLKLSMLPR